MKKHNGRRRARNQTKRSLRVAATRAIAPAQLAAKSVGPRSWLPLWATLVERSEAVLRRVDAAALAILLMPLAAMALFEGWSRDTRPDAGRRPAQESAIRLPGAEAPPWIGDLTLETLPVVPDAHGRRMVASVEPPRWDGDLAAEAMPVMPDVRSRVAVVSAEPLPARWHGDTALEAMPVVADAHSRARMFTVEPPPMPWRGDLAHEDMPLQPDPATWVPPVPVTGTAVAAAEAAPICVPDTPLGAMTAASEVPEPVPREPLAFGHALAEAARAQADQFVIYNSRYMTISYPRGDTLPLYGVCTDVVVRAYRALGIDLQELIHTSRLGRGDPSIDHRRVEVIRRFLERHGSSYEISEFAEDFLPGDIVTYYRPHGRVSQHHIAIVSDRIGPSGRPLIVHNRGWGPQLEDALFVDRITGHYRFTPNEAEAFVRSRSPRARRDRTADISSAKRR